ncbi:MAG: hypothetical protein H6697_07415 [Myxococcales bacterium]|nr:hypothetical protein [Myxococcales bacterium]MCB9520386.1 hypothetical protein [Myxococcales bacterium]
MRSTPNPSVWRRAAIASLLACCPLLISACGSDEESVETYPDDGDGALTESEALTLVVGPEGGEISASAGSLLDGVRVVVPPGALAAETTLTIHGTVDPTPLPETAAAVGLALVIEPEATEFAVPVRVTVPFEPNLRDVWETPDDECKVWFRDGEGWSRADAVDSDSSGVTVELDFATTFAAGVLTVPLSIGCRFNCSPPDPPSAECLDGDRFCLERLGDAHLATSTTWYSYTQGQLFWQHTPASGQIALASWDTVSRVPGPTSGSVQLGTTGPPVGDVVVDRSGVRWLGFRHRANVRFEGTRPGQAFDSFAGSTDPRAIGVAFDQSSALPARLRTTAVPPTSISPLSQQLSSVIGTRAAGTSRVYGASAIDDHRQIGRALSQGVGAFPILAWGAQTGVSFNRLTPVSGGFDVSPQTCAGAPLRQVLGAAASPGRFGWAMLCLRQDNRGALIVNGATRATFEVNQTPRGVLAVDGNGNAWLADAQRAQIVRFAADGGATVLSLTTAAESSPEYASMVPVSLHYDTGIDSLILVTRGAGGIRAFWQISTPG